jgi:hypothetical protein
MEELNIDKYSSHELKKLFTKHSGINCLNEFTVQDIEDSKKRMFMKLYKESNKEELKDFLDRASEKIISDKFMNGTKETHGVVVKNTVRDNLNADYKNTITRLILLDSQFRPDLLKEPTDFICTMNEKIVNTVSLEISNIQIPYTFYNIENVRGNNRFDIDFSGGTTVKVVLPDANYTIQQILDFIVANSNSKITSATLSPTTGLVTFVSNSKISINFMPEGVKLNTSLGWYLGFRSFTGSSLASADANHTFLCNIDGTPEAPGSKTATSIACAPRLKYFVVVVDDFNKTQTADTLVQVQLDPLNATPTSYFTQDPYLDCLTPANISTYLDSSVFPNRTLTKAQVYTRAQQNQSRNNLYLQNQRLDVNSPNQILAVFPFDGAKLNWGDNYFSDKCKYKREYHSPTNLERFHVKIYDDTGFLLKLNGNNWYMTLMTTNLYKY